MPNILERADLTESRTYFELACKASREHDATAAYAINKFGSYGPQISGIVRDHFPEDIKTRLRMLARTVAKFSDEAYAARPKCVRIATIRALGKAIAARDGSGFYGPQA